MEMTENYIFGPVNSRRLGRSLGIDLLPFKTCSYDCVYCECGATTSLTTKRADSGLHNVCRIRRADPLIVDRADHQTSENNLSAV